MFENSDIGSASDEPADPSQLAGGNQTSGADSRKLSLFSILKLIALMLVEMNSDPGK